MIFAGCMEVLWFYHVFLLTLDLEAFIQQFTLYVDHL